MDARTTRMIKCYCPQCGYIARVSMKWIRREGAPHCPKHGAMTTDLAESAIDQRRTRQKRHKPTETNGS